jgi:two-component system alkaline phosphatase synthesis response regulator PhoP
MTNDNSAKGNILVIDDEIDLIELLKYNLAKDGYNIQFALNGYDGIHFAELTKPDLIILDLMLPDLTGYEVCKRIKANSAISAIPIIFLSAKQEEVDKILGFEAGGEDYMTKPFSVNELIARIRAIFKRTYINTSNRLIEIDGGKTPKQSEFNFKNITVNVPKHSVTVKNQEIKLSPTEFKLLVFLMTYAGEVFSREKLLDNIWGNDSFVEPRTVDVHIRRLRSNIEIDKTVKFIDTVRGAGYRFINED